MGMQAELEIRSATARDLSGVLEIYAQLAEQRAESLPATKDDAARILEEILADRRRVLLVAVTSRRVVGTADLVIVANLTHGGKPWAIVENMAVEEAERRTGVGASLMREIERRAREAGCYKVQLLSRKNRKEAHAFYDAVGYEASAEGFRRYFDLPSGAG
ncbi:MAG: GNAT family N-acetyltransferase [Acidimicrobiia bacterium]